MQHLSVGFPVTMTSQRYFFNFFSYFIHVKIGFLELNEVIYFLFILTLRMEFEGPVTFREGIKFPNFVDTELDFCPLCSIKKAK